MPNGRKLWTDLATYCTALRLVLSACVLLSSSILVSANDGLCDQAAQHAAVEHGVPIDLMRAIAEVESGLAQKSRVTAWPWTLNVAGKGYRFDSSEEALDRIKALLAQGTTHFDIGCFQINVRWHGSEFSSPEAMLDPVQNARYAARFLKTLYTEFGDWSVAAGAYHSRTAELALRYRSRVKTALARLDTSPALPPTPQPRRVARTNRYPLLVGGAGATSTGSLVPVAGSTAPRRPMF